MKEQAKAWQLSVLTNLEVLHATYFTHAFARHVHEEFCVGVIVGGVEAVHYRGETHLAPQGSIVVFQPGEGHSNWAANKAGWSFQVIYPSIPLLQLAIDPEQSTPTPVFANPVIDDRDLCHQLIQFHALVQQPASSRLEQETRLLQVLRALVTRHAVEGGVRSRRTGREHRIVQQIKDYLQRHYAEDPSLTQLSALCGLSPFHLTRVFRAAVGVPPHAYLTHLRIAHAKTQLCDDRSIAELAIELGFTDQSHFTHIFKAWVGVTPGQYRMQMQVMAKGGRQRAGEKAEGRGQQKLHH
jgi:AraC-like DNA-binding protein